MFDGKYTLWGGEHSLFTQLEAMLNYLDVDYEFRLKSEETAHGQAVWHALHPGLQTPEGWFIHDTTPIGLMLNAKFPDRAIVPATRCKGLRPICWRIGRMNGWSYAISSRWCYPHNVDHVAKGFMPTESAIFAREA